MASADPLYLAIQNDEADPTLESVARKERLLLQTITDLGDSVFSHNPQKTFDRRWPVGQVAEMVGISRQMIRIRENEGRLPRPKQLPNGRSAGYTLDHINRIRDFFGTRPTRAASDEPVVLSFSTFKSDLGKTTLAVHGAQYLAMRGYRILLVDSSPQANASALFGLNTDLELLHWHHEAANAKSSEDGERSLNYTLDEFLAGEFREFANAIRASYFPGIDLVPGSMALSQVEYQLAEITRRHPDRLNDLRRGIRSVWDDYDIVIIDPSPNLGPLAKSALRAANALAIPMQPTAGDVASTATFLSRLRADLSKQLSPESPAPYKFDTFVFNDLDEDKPTHRQIVETVRTRFPAVDIVTAMMTDTSEIDVARKEMRTLYDSAPLNRAGDPHAQAVRRIDKLNEELETRIRRTWPSHREQLLNEARI